MRYTIRHIKHGLGGELLRQRDDRVVLESDAGRAPRPADLADLAELANAIFEYFEIFHNRQRRHSALGMLTPTEFEAQHQTVPVA